MDGVVMALKQRRDGIIGISRAKNVLNKSASNLVVHSTPLCFIVYLRAYLKKKTFLNLLVKMRIVLEQLNEMVGF